MTNTIGESELSIDKFLQNIDDWINNNKIQPLKFEEYRAHEAINCPVEELFEKNSKELLELVYILYEYLEHLQSVLNRESCVLDYATESIWSIIAKKIKQLPPDYTKGQKINYNLAIQDSHITIALNKLKNNTQSRINMLSNKIDYIKKRTEILHEYARRKLYEH